MSLKNNSQVVVESLSNIKKRAIEHLSVMNPYNLSKEKIAMFNKNPKCYKDMAIARYEKYLKSTKRRKKYEVFIVTQAVFIESIFILENKFGLSRNDIDREIFCILEDQSFEFVLDFDIYLFLSLYTSFTNLDVTDLYLLIHSKEIESLTLDVDLAKKIKTVKF